MKKCFRTGLFGLLFFVHLIASAQGVRIWPLAGGYGRADADGSNRMIVMNQPLEVSFPSKGISLRFGEQPPVKGLNPSQLLDRDGNPYGATVPDASIAWENSYNAVNTPVSSGTGGGGFVSDAGQLTGTLNPARFPNSGVAAGVYGNLGNYVSVTVDQYGRVTSVQTFPIPTVPNSLTAFDNTGTKFVNENQLANALNNTNLTGLPTAPTAATSANGAQVANNQWVNLRLLAYQPLLVLGGPEKYRKGNNELGDFSTDVQTAMNTTIAPMGDTLIRHRNQIAQLLNSNFVTRLGPGLKPSADSLEAEADIPYIYGAVKGLEPIKLYTTPFPWMANYQLNNNYNTSGGTISNTTYTYPSIKVAQQLSTSTSATGRATYYSGYMSNAGFPYGSWDFDITGVSSVSALPTTADDYEAILGIANALDPAVFAGFTIATYNSVTGLFAVTRTTTANQFATPLATVPTTPFKWRVRSLKDRSSVFFYINDVLVATHVTANNLPFASSTVFAAMGITKRAGTSPAILYNAYYEPTIKP